MNSAINQFISIHKDAISNIKRKNPDFSDSDAIEMLKEEYDKYLIKFMNDSNKIVLRWNDSGDWFSEEYVTIGSNVVRRLRAKGVNITTTTYTKIAQISADIRGVWDAKKDFAIYSVGGASKKEVRKYKEIQATDAANRPVKDAISPDGTNFMNPITDKPYNEKFEDLNYIFNIDKGGANNNEVLRSFGENYMGMKNVDLTPSTVSDIKAKIKELMPFFKNDFKEQMQAYLKRIHDKDVEISDIIYYDEMRKSFEIRIGQEMKYYVIVPKGSGDDAAIYPSTKMVINLMH
jgi:gas vesicle protein